MLFRSSPFRKVFGLRLHTNPYLNSKVLNLFLTFNLPIHLYKLLTRQDLKIPEDISIVGFDNHYPILDKEGNDILTTINVPYRAVGNKAATLLLSQIKEEEKEPKEIILPVTLVIRNSTAICKQ